MPQTGRTRLVDSDWEREIRAGLQHAGSKVLIACPFIKESVVARLLAACHSDSILVVTRFSLRDFANGVSDIGALRALHRGGADVRGLRDLHAKVFVFGHSRAIVTSANSTEAAMARNREFGCVSTDAPFITACERYVSRLHASGTPLDARQLDDWQATVETTLRTTPIDPITSLPDFGAPAPRPRKPPISVAPGVDANREGWASESQRAHIKFAGRGHLRSPLDTPILDEISRSGSYKFCSYPAGGGHPRRVADGDTMFLSRMTSAPNDHRIIGRAIALKHDDVRDVATPDDRNEREWLHEYPYLVRVHHPVFIDGVLGDGISLIELDGRARLRLIPSNSGASTSGRT